MNVIGGLRRCQDDDGNTSERSIGFDFRQHFPSVLSREIEVEKDQVRPGGLLVRAGATEEIDGLDTVDDVGKIDGHPRLAKRFERKPRIARIILHEEDVNSAPVHKMFGLSGWLT